MPPPPHENTTLRLSSTNRTERYFYKSHNDFSHTTKQTGNCVYACVYTNDWTASVCQHTHCECVYSARRTPDTVTILGKHDQKPEKKTRGAVPSAWRVGVVLSVWWWCKVMESCLITRYFLECLRFVALYGRIAA